MPVSTASLCLSKVLGLRLLAKWTFSTEIAVAVCCLLRFFECTGIKHTAGVCLGKDSQRPAMSALNNMVERIGANEIINTVSSGMCCASSLSSAYMNWVVSSLIINTSLISARIESSATPTFHSIMLNPAFVCVCE